MKKYLNVLESTKLFKGINAEELMIILNCINAGIKSVRKKDVVLLAGDKPQYVGIVLEGQVHILREDSDGNRSLIATAMPGDVFAEELCCAGVLESPITAMVDADSTVMLLSFYRVLHMCPNTCSFHMKLIENMLKLIAGKNLQLQSRMDIASLKSIRMKVMRYLESFIPKQGHEITIPYNREELADYLCVDRSALSHELAKMKSDGLLEYRKNKFILRPHTHRAP